MVRNAVIAAAVVAALAAGCSGDDGEERADRPFCVVQEEIDDRLSSAFAEDEDASEEELDEALVDAAAELRDDGVLDDAREAAPPEVAAPVDTVIRAVELVADGDPAAFTGGEVDVARTAVEDHCFAEAAEESG